MTRCLLGLLAVLAGLLTAVQTGPLLAQSARQASVEQLDLQIDILADGTLRVIQTEQTQYTGTYQRDGRDIPFRGIGSLTEVQLREPGRLYQQGYNEPFTFSAARVGDAVRVDWWFPPVADATRTTVLSYRVTGALRPTADGAELSWLAIPGQRGVGIESAAVVLRMPPVSGQVALEAQAWIGGRELPAEAVDRRELRFAVGSLSPDAALVLQARLPGGVVAVPSSPLQTIYDLRAAYPDTIRPALERSLLVLGAVVLVLGLINLIGLWPVRRLAAASRPALPQPAGPPGSRSPALAGWLADGRLGGREVAATLVDLVGRGIVSVLPESAVDQVRLTAPNSRPLGLEAHERTVLTALFPTVDTQLSAAAGHWRLQEALFADQVRASAAQQGLWIEHGAQQLNRSRLKAGLGLAACLALGGLAYRFLEPLIGYTWVPLMAGGLVCLAALVLAGRRSRLTPGGLRESAGWRAYARALADRPGQLATDLSSTGRFRQLAYAVALGLEEGQLAPIGSSAVPTEAASAPRAVEGGASSATSELEPADLARAALRAFVEPGRPVSPD